MKRLVGLTLGASLLTALTACSTAENDPAAATPIPAETVVSVETETADEVASESTQAEAGASVEPDSTAAPETNERGNLVKTIGERAGITDANGDSLVEFTVTAIEPNFQCTGEFATPPTNGQYIAITIDAQTTSALADQPWPAHDFNPYDFSIISPDGTRENDSTGDGGTYSCVDESETLPMEIGPGEHVTGKVLLDSGHETGSLIYKPGAYMLPSGWEWGF